MRKTWKIKLPNPRKQKELSDALNIDTIVAQVLINRKISDIEEARDFLSADITKLHDPFLIKDMDKAVKRIRQAKDKNEQVLVFGDYDVDGVTSSAIMNKLLTKMGIAVNHHIPHRVHDGYGLNHKIVDMAKEEGVDLLITVDCGITAVDEVRRLKDAGIDVIIIDHHETSKDGIPEADAIVNPKQFDCAYPFKELASVGLVAKLAQALAGEIEREFLDLAALGTVADIVPLRGENRIFVKEGLRHISQTKNLGLKALMKTARIGNKKISPYYIGFIIGPRINATGRMDSAHKSLDLFLAQSEGEALELARTLEKLNTERQSLQKLVIQEADRIVSESMNFKKEKVIVLSKEGWHKGVLGIVASRLTDKYYRPSVVISLKDGVGTASCRSIDGFHLHDALESCAQCLENFGGHEGAAGLTIRQENIDPFKDLINQLAESVMEPKKLMPTIHIDSDIPLSSVNMNLAQMLETLEPFGEANPPVVFCSRNVEVRSAPRRLGRDTLKFWVSDGEATVSAIGFGMAKYEPLVQRGEKIDIAYEVSIDDWNKAPTVQLKLKDIRMCEEEGD